MRVLRAALLGFACVAVATPALAQRDHMRCYAVKAVKGPPVFGKTDATKKFYAALNDELDLSNPQGLDPLGVPSADATYQIKKTRELCFAADKNGEGIANPNQALLSYQINAQKGQCQVDLAIPCKKDADCPSGPCLATPKFDKKQPQNQSVRIADQFVDLRVDFGKQVMALVPATAAPSSNGDWFGVPAGEEHYKCYSIKPTKASCAGGSNDGGFCKAGQDAVFCPGGACIVNPKFPKETHPAGISASVVDPFSAVFDPGDEEKSLLLGKLRMFCQAADKKLEGNAVENRLAPQAGLLCYASKPSKGACDGGDNDNQPCKKVGKEDECPGGGICRLEPKFDKKNLATQGGYVEDQIFQHRLDIAKEGNFCIPACRGVESFAFKPGLLAHITHLALGPNSAPAELVGLPRGVDVDANPSTHAPNTESADGIDAMLQGLGPILNPLLQEELDSGGFTLLFQASALANGTVTISGFTGEIDANPGCTVGTDPDPLDPGNPADPCNYTTEASNFELDLTGSCRDEALISLDVTVTGADTVPTADAIGGGPGNNFTLSIPFGGESFEITANNVRVEAEITHDGSEIEVIRGVLGGGVNHAELVASVAALPNSCNGGANDGNECTSGGDCPGGTCELVGGFTSTNLSNFIFGAFPPDLDLDPADDGNWPGYSDPADLAKESVSLGLLFRATKAVGTDIQ